VVKVDEIIPGGTAIEEGTVRAALLLDRVTEVGICSVWPSATVQVAEAPADKVAELHCTDETAMNTNSVMDLETPPAIAVMVAFIPLVTAPVLIVKLAEAAPAGTVTDAGTVRYAALLDNATGSLPGAGPANVTVQTAELRPGIRVTPPGRLHCSHVTVTGGATARDTVTDAPPYPAVITADWLDATDAVEAVNGADRAPAGMVTDAGTVTAALLADRDTTAPPTGAVRLRPTVQVELAPPVTEAGLQFNVDSLG
jgi:hypothetical protein